MTKVKKELGILEFLQGVKKEASKPKKKCKFTKTLKISFSRIWRKVTVGVNNHLQ